MSVQTYTGNVEIVWDDSVVLIFSFTFSGTKYFCGFVHQIFSIQNTVGSQTQVNAVTQTVQQSAVQQAFDPQTWVETVKTGARGTSNQISVAFDDSTNVNYTTQTAQPFQLQQLFAIYG